MVFEKVFWITGLSGAGKTTTSLSLRDRLLEKGILPVMIDGDSFREILGNRFDYSYEDRLYLAGCYGRMCSSLVEQGHTVICSTISMFDSVREWNRKNIKNYIEIYLKISHETLRKRDPKGLYAAAQDHSRRGQKLVEIQQEFQEPKNADLVFDESIKSSLEDTVSKIIAYAEKIKINLDEEGR